MGPHDRSECSEEKIYLKPVDLDVKLKLNMKLQGTQHRKEIADVLRIRKLAGLLLTTLVEVQSLQVRDLWMLFSHYDLVPPLKPATQLKKAELACCLC